jgi:hypothetical protein
LSHAILGGKRRRRRRRRRRMAPACGDRAMMMGKRHTRLVISHTACSSA